jgi:hypothetical protein
MLSHLTPRFTEVTISDPKTRSPFNGNHISWLTLPRQNLKERAERATA